MKVDIIRKNFLRLLTLDFLFRKASGFSRSVLLIKDDGIGDFFIFSGTLKIYKDFFERAGFSLSLIVSSEVFGIARILFPGIKIKAIDKSKYYKSLDYRRNFLNFLHEVLSPAIIISSTLRSSICDDIARFSGRGIEKIGYEGEILLKKKKHRPYTKIVVSYDRLAPPADGYFNHVIFHELQLLNGITGGNFSLYHILPDLSVFKKTEADASDYMVFIPGAGDRRRILPLEKQVEVLKKLLAETNLKCYILGGKGEKYISRFLKRHFEGDRRIVDLIGTLKLEDALRLISGAKLAIGMETGLTHGAWILGIPTVMIYGGGHFGRFVPFFPSGKIVFKEMDCFGCNWRCKYSGNYFKCVSSIEVSEILKTAFLLLDKVNR